jgi:hypothetical protein
VGERDLRVDDIGVHAGSGLRLVLVLVEGTEGEGGAVRDTSETLSLEGRGPRQSRHLPNRAAGRRGEEGSSRRTQGAPFSTSEAQTSESRSTYLTPFMARMASTVCSAK